MRIRLTPFTVRLFRMFLLPIVTPIKVVQWVIGSGKKPVYPSTLEGDPFAYSGEQPVVVAIWSTWASVWTAATEPIVQGLQQELAGRCEFVYLEATSRTVTEKFRVDVVPAVLLFQNGQEVGRFINLLDADELRRCVAERVTDAATN